MSNLGLRESPPYTVLVFAGPEPEPREYRSVVGRGVSTARRIDVSSLFDLQVAFFRLKHEREGIMQVPLGHFALDGGVPLVWPVPDSAQHDDILLRIGVYVPKDEFGMPLTESSALVHIGDHWSTT